MENVLPQCIDKVSGSTGSLLIVHAPHDAIKQLLLIDGKFYCVSPSFAFPTGITCLNGWSMWLMGKTVFYNNKTFKMKPFYRTKGSEIPKSCDLN